MPDFTDGMAENVAENQALASEEVAAANAIAKRLFSDDDLRALKSMSDLTDLLNSRELNVTTITDVLGDGFELVDENDILVKIPFVMLTETESMGDFGPFVTIRVMTKDGRKLIVNDGSTGIRDQMRSLRAKGIELPVWVPGGLRVSRYQFIDPNTGEEKSARTFYLATS